MLRAASFKIILDYNAFSKITNLKDQQNTNKHTNIIPTDITTSGLIGTINFPVTFGLPGSRYYWSDSSKLR